VARIQQQFERFSETAAADKGLPSSIPMRGLPGSVILRDYATKAPPAAEPLSAVAQPN
jgi:hypothetical protein